MSSTLDLVKKRLCGTRELSNVSVYNLSEPVRKKRKKSSKVQWKAAVSSGTEIETFTDPNIFKSLKQLSKELEKFCENATKSCYVTEAFLTSSLQKCLCDKKYYSRDAIVSLINNDFITKGVNDMLCQCLIKYNDMDILNSLKSHQSILSEKMTVEFLKHIIRKMPSEDIEKILSDTSLTECPLDTNTVNDIMFLLTLDLEEFQLQQYMKLFSTTEAAVLLQFLRYLLMHVSPALWGETKRVLEINENVTENKILSWIDSLVTAHLLSLTSSPTLLPLVKALRQTTQNQKSFYNDIKQLAPYADFFKNQDSLIEITTNRKYTIETIVL